MSLNLILRIAFLLAITVGTYAQDINPGPRIVALGNSGVAVQDPWSMQSNQAGIVGATRPVAAIAYENNYLSTEISTRSAVVVVPVGNNFVGLSFQNYGLSAYSEQKIGLAYAKRFGKNFSVALNINAHQVRISQYGSDKTLSVEAGIQFKPVSRLTIGSHIANPSRSAYNKQVDARVPTIFELGAAYEVSDKVRFNGSLVKDLDWLTDARFGLEYGLIDWFLLRGGVDINPFRQFAGFGCKYQKLRLDAAVASHPVLGYSPQLSLAYEF